MRPTLESVFMRFVEFDTNGRGCWFWGGGLNGQYGRFNQGPEAQAHRAAWRIFRGPIPKGLDVLHWCDVPCCVNPAHLWFGTHKDNMNDMWRKGRAAWQKQWPKKKPRGMSRGALKFGGAF